MKREPKTFKQECREITACVVRGTLSAKEAKAKLAVAAEREAVRRLAHQLPQMFRRVRLELEKEVAVGELGKLKDEEDR